MFGPSPRIKPGPILYGCIPTCLIAIAVIVATPFALMFVLRWLSPGPSGADRLAIEQRYNEWHRGLADPGSLVSFKIMSPTYREGHYPEDVYNRFKPEDNTLKLSPGYGLRGDNTHAYLRPTPHGPEFEWKKIDGVWYMTGEVRWFQD